MAKRVGQITPICCPKTTRAYCCTKPNWIGSSRLWITRPRPHRLGLPAYIFAARKKIAGRYFRGKIFSREDIFARRYFRGKLFSREDIFAGRYFRGDSIFAKISSRENISNPIFAKFSSRENKVLYSIRRCMSLVIFYDLKIKSPFLSTLWGRRRGSLQAYSLYAFINVDNCERPLTTLLINTLPYYVRTHFNYGL